MGLKFLQKKVSCGKLHIKEVRLVETYKKDSCTTSSTNERRMVSLRRKEGGFQ